MSSPQCDVVIVGAGAAGLTAAIGLAKSGFRVVVVEAAAFAGAENWSGCVYFTENLAHPDILGPEGVEALAWERRLIERGIFATDGHGLLGMKYRDPEAFRNCFTVLRPIYDHHLSQFALRHGAKVLADTTAESLIRENGRIIGVCTNRGALYGKLTFLAEGDASHLVTREGYERSKDPRDAPKFLQGIKQVLELPPRAIEQRFGVDAEQGVAYEMLVRNGTLRGKKVHLNMGGFLYTNRQSLSVGLVLPADNLHQHFEGDPNLLMEWFLSLPSLRPWLEGAKPGPFGAKIIRGGGAKDIPTLIDDGLAIGGAASAIGIDFPYPNFTGPATAMGLLISRAARAIRDENGTFSRDELERYYLRPLQKSHYWKDVEFLKHWPGYVKKTSFFFGRNIDLALGSAYLWTRPSKGMTGRWKDWLNFVRQVAGGEHKAAVETDLKHFREALRVREVVGDPSPWRLLLDGALNTARDLLGRPRALPARGDITLHYSVAGGAEPSGLPPMQFRKLFEGYAPAIAAAARVVYSNDTKSLATKLPAATRLLTGHVSLKDFARVAGMGFMAGTQWLSGRFRGKATESTDAADAYLRAAIVATDLTPATTNATPAWEARLAQLSYETVKSSHIRVLWPQSLADKNAVAQAGLWHVCPAHVYEARLNATGQLQVVVNFENCIKCETCLRTSNIVDWGRDGAHRFVYAVHSPVVAKLLADLECVVDGGRWMVDGEEGVAGVQREVTSAQQLEAPAEIASIVDQLEQKLVEFEDALAQEPRTIDNDRAEYLQMLARYAHQLALQLSSAVSRDAERNGAERANQILTLTQRRVEYVAAGRYSWAAADGRQLRFHHLPELRLLTGLTNSASGGRKPSVPGFRQTLRQRLNAIFPPSLWRDLEQQKHLPPEVDREIRAVVGEVPRLDFALPASFRRRKLVLSELASRDPSLAFRVASHLWARDMAMLVGGEFVEKGKLWAEGGEWACLAIIDKCGQASMVPARDAQAVLVVDGQNLKVFSARAPALTLQPLPTLGLRGAGLVRIRTSGQLDAVVEQSVDRDARLRAWEATSGIDLTAIAEGIADHLCQRASDHASGRVQFPGLFHDEESRDAIGKFGAVKKMVAEMAASKSLMERCLPAYYVAKPPAIGINPLKAVVAEILGSAPGSIAYNAGQVFGGTGYSEDDTLSKLYRDAAALRFLGVPNSEAYLRHGRMLMENWTADGRQLSKLPLEKALFEEVIQRQALNLEAACIRKLQTRLVECINAWKSSKTVFPPDEAQTAFIEAVGRQDAFLFVSKHLLDWTHRVMEACCAKEEDLPLLRTWLNRVQKEFDGFLTLVSTLDVSTSLPLTGELVGPEISSPPITQYADFLKTRLLYSSGDFLSKPTDPNKPQYVPEMVETDEFLSKRNKELIDLIQRQFGQPRDGMTYERYLEEKHRPDGADLNFLRDNGFFRYPIPKELGGEGRSKADYYLLTVNTHRLADAAISLTIQVNSSLGTTPVLFARDKDLPKALKSTSDPALREELVRRREAADLFCRWVASGQISAFALTEPSAGSDTARVGTRAKLRQVPAELEGNGVYRFVPPGAKQPRRLLDGRRVVFKSLRAGGVGHLSDAEQIAADQTQGANAPRSESLQGCYAYSESEEPAPICFDEYDYETDACKKRYFVADGRKVYFDDIAQLRERDGELWYDYWELNGAKMWITNGRVMGIMALYAKTDQGVTGFMVDRHAEGLIVGKDEAKMGQSGSPTNELALQAVRVPRENVIGLEGRGQVNALETLNVGRAGLAMSAMCQMVRLCEWSRTFAQKRYGAIPPWIGWRLQWMEEERFISEAVAYEIIGRFEHKQTKSVRMESAIAKMLVSELFHHSIELAEEIHGLDGQTQEHLIEKRKRDARVLNIYEGTNEIQRFLILKELTDCATSWNAPSGGRKPPEREARVDAIPDSGALRPPLGEYSGFALKIDDLKTRLRGLTTEAVAFFGQQLWQNPNLQASCFILSEAAAWIAAAESTLGRLTWLARKNDAEPALLATGRRAVVRCQCEVDHRLDRFAEELVNLRRGQYAPEIRAASLLFRQKDVSAVAPPSHVIDRQMSVLVVLDAPGPGVPQPRTQNGRLMEPFRVLSDGDRAALETALSLRDGGNVRIEVIMVGPASAATVLREVISLGVDRVRLVVAKSPISPDNSAAALAHALRGDENYDLVLGGVAIGDTQEGLVALLTAHALGAQVVGSAAQIAVDTKENSLRLLGGDGQTRLRSLPAAVMMEPGPKLRAFAIDGWLDGLAKTVETIDWPGEIAASPQQFDEAATAGPKTAADEAPKPLLPREASSLVLQASGLAGVSSARSKDGQMKAAPPQVIDVGFPSFAAKESRQTIVVVLGCDANGQLHGTARRALDAAQFLTPFFDEAQKSVVLLTPRSHDAQQRALRELTTLTPFDICLLGVDGAEVSEEVASRVLAECLSGLENFPAAVVGEPWTESALASLAAASGTVDPIALRVRSLDRYDSQLSAESLCAKGKLRTRQTLAPFKGKTVWLSLTADAEIGATAPPPSRALRRVERWTPSLERFYGRGDMQRLIQELKKDAGLVRLADAEFIIDVGFGVGNRDGFEAVVEPLQAALSGLGVRGLTIGGSRKVTEELHLLPTDRQIGQSGVSVNPRVLLAIGVSGAPQHVNYIGQGTTIIAFNRDPEAPLMTLNKRQSKPKVYPVIGDLFETVPALIACLREVGNESTGRLQNP